MKKWAAILLVLPVLFMMSKGAYAHPGRTASDGCHYCRTNCDKWGEVWNVRHCHGGSTRINIEPTRTETPRKTPVATPNSIDKNDPTPAGKSSPVPVVEGAQTEDSNGSSAGQLLGWAGLVGFGYLIYKYRGKNE